MSRMTFGKVVALRSCDAAASGNRSTKMAQQLPEPIDPAAYGNLEPDFIVPEQFFAEQQPHWSGEFALLWTVFSDGIETFRREILLGREQGEAFLETVEWIEMTGHESVFSFERLCELFRFNPVKVRRSLREWREQQRSSAATSRAA